MRLEYQVVSLELANKLKELGVKADSYFVWAKSAYSGKHCLVSKNDEQLSKLVEMHDEPGAGDFYDHIPAYSVAELGEMLPHTVWSQVAIPNGLPRTWVCIHLLNKTLATTEADARAKMLVYLIENEIMEGGNYEV